MSATSNRVRPAAAAPPRMQDVLDHDLGLAEETRRIRDEVRAFAEQHLRPIAHELAHREESVESFPHDLLRQMGQAGLLRIPFAERDGGRGLQHPVAATAAAIEELAYVSSGIAAVYDVQCILAGNALTQASEAVRDRYLLPLMEGRLIASFATTEPAASSDLSAESLQTIARPTVDGYRLDGHKRFISNAPVADVVVVLCKTPEGPTMLAVDLDSPGVSVGPPDRKLGNRVQLTADIVFHDVHVPTDHVVGPVGRGLRAALGTLTCGRIGIAASGVGMAQAAFDLAAAHLRERRAFGQHLASFQHWQFLMAERATEIENARSLYRKAASRRDEGVEFPEPEAAMAKHYGTRLAVDMARDAVQALGGYGFVRQLGTDGSTYGVEAVYRDSKIAEIYEGTNEIQKWIIARTIFGRDLTG